METKVVLTTGPVEHLFSDPKNPPCVCCPGGRHRYGVHVELPEGAVSKYKHLNDVASGFHDFCAQFDMVGKRVRITFEVAE